MGIPIIIVIECAFKMGTTWALWILKINGTISDVDFPLRDVVGEQFNSLLILANESKELVLNQKDSILKDFYAMVKT